MSDLTPDLPDVEQDWPTHCPTCGTALESATLDLDTTNADRPELRPGEMARVDYCPNPDCPDGKPAEPGGPGTHPGAGEADAGTSVDDVRATPGSLGGDNGGG